MTTFRDIFWNCVREDCPGQLDYIDVLQNTDELEVSMCETKLNSVEGVVVLTGCKFHLDFFANEAFEKPFEEATELCEKMGWKYKVSPCPC